MDEPPRFHLLIPAEPAAMAIVRGRLRDWLNTLAWPTPDLEEVVLAVNEACTNVVDHAYPPQNTGNVELSGQLADTDTDTGNGERHVTVVVRDWGRWRLAPADRGSRGYGLTVMRGCMRTVSLEQSGEGTTVTLTSFTVPH